VGNEAVAGLLDQVGADNALITNGDELFPSVPTGTPSNLTGGIAAGPWSDDGIASQFNFTIIDNGALTGSGYTSIGFLLVRLNTSAAPGGSFFSTVANSSGTIGVDGAVCATRISPYIVRAVDNGGIVTLKEILAEGADLPATSAKQLDPLFVNTTVPLTSSGKQVVFSNAVQNAQNQLVKDNSRHGSYEANPSLVQMTVIDPSASTPPVAYGTLSGNRVGGVLSSANSRFSSMVSCRPSAGRREGICLQVCCHSQCLGTMVRRTHGRYPGLGSCWSLLRPSPTLQHPHRTIVPSHWLDTLASQVPPEILKHQREAAIGDVKVRYGR